MKKGPLEVLEHFRVIRKDKNLTYSCIVMQTNASTNWKPITKGLSESCK
jgi:hypothetical protein